MRRNPNPFLKKIHAGRQSAFYSTMREKLFEILGGKVCSGCGYRDERALGFAPVYGDVFDDVKRGGIASSWEKYISSPDLARKDLVVLCLNCNAIREPLSRHKARRADGPRRQRFPR